MPELELSSSNPTGGEASESMRSTTDAATPALESAIALLRADVAVRDEWRSNLLRDLSSAPQPSPWAQLPEVHRPAFFMRPFAVRPIVALAACALAMVAGAMITRVLITSSPSTNSQMVANVAGTPVVPVVSRANAPASGTQTVIRFALVAPGAKSVSVVGDFNGWNPRATPLVAGVDGTTWQIEMPLSAGRHVYAFVVDGDIVADPSAPRVVDHDFGVQNSVVLVGAS